MAASIEDYGLIGDCESAALVSKDKRIGKKSSFTGFAAWMPYPNTSELAGFMKVNDTPAAGR
jgi:hypothetical protein